MNVPRLAAALLFLCGLGGAACGGSPPEPGPAADAAEPPAMDEPSGDYAALPLARMVGLAKLAVAGEVVQLQEETFTFRVSETWIGELPREEDDDEPERTIRVRQHHPSRFDDAERTTPYRTGQRFALFLTRGEEDPPERPWRILGLGGEGELPLEGGFVYLPGQRVEGWDLEPREVHGTKRRIQRAPLKDFRAAAESYGEHFTWREEEGGRLVPSREEDAPELDAYRSRSDVHAELARQTLQELRGG